MNADLNQLLEEALKRAVVAEQARIEAEAQARLAGALAVVAQADANATQAVVDVKETEAAWRKAGEAQAIASEAKTKAEAKLAEASETLEAVIKAKTKAQAEQTRAAKVAQASADAKVRAQAELATAREELAKIQPPAAQPAPAPEPETAPKLEAKSGFWDKIRNRISCPHCGLKTPEGQYCEACGGAL